MHERVSRAVYYPHFIMTGDVRYYIVTDVLGGVDVDGVVPGCEGVLGVGRAVVGDDAGCPVHGPEVQPALPDLEAIGVQLATGLEDLKVGVLGHQAEVVVDEEDHLLLVHLCN